MVETMKEGWKEKEQQHLAVLSIHLVWFRFEVSILLDHPPWWVPVVAPGATRSA